LRLFSGLAPAWRNSARPGPELFGVRSCRGVLLDPVASDIERQHHRGDALLLSHQAGLAVDRTLQDRQVGYLSDDTDQGARDLLGTFDRAEPRAGEAAAVGDRRGAGVEEADEGVD